MDKRTKQRQYKRQEGVKRTRRNAPLFEHSKTERDIEKC